MTPTHQLPTGAILGLGRSLEFLKWAFEAGVWVRKDYYDSEFRYGGWLLSALDNLDPNGWVIYAETFSKTLAPTIQLGYLAAP